MTIVRKWRFYSNSTTSLVLRSGSEIEKGARWYPLKVKVKTNNHAIGVRYISIGRSALIAAMRKQCIQSDKRKIGFFITIVPQGPGRIQTSAFSVTVPYVQLIQPQPQGVRRRIATSAKWSQVRRPVIGSTTRVVNSFQRLPHVLPNLSYVWKMSIDLSSNSFRQM